MTTENSLSESEVAAYYSERLPDLVRKGDEWRAFVRSTGANETLLPFKGPPVCGSAIASAGVAVMCTTSRGF